MSALERLRCPFCRGTFTVLHANGQAQANATVCTMRRHGVGCGLPYWHARETPRESVHCCVEPSRRAEWADKLEPAEMVEGRGR